MMSGLDRLPLNLRYHIYRDVGLTLPRPVELNPRVRLASGGDSSPEGMYKQQTLPTELFTVSRDIGNEARYLFYSENNFILTVEDVSSFDILRQIRPVAFRLIPDLNIQLRHNTCKCSICYPKGVPEKPMDFLVGDCYTLLERWCEVVSRFPSSIFPARLSLTLLSGVLNEPNKQPVHHVLLSFQREDSSTPDKECSGNREVCDLIHRVGNRLKNGNRDEKPFPFADLPRNIRLRILKYTDLATFTSVDGEPNTIKIENEHAVASPSKRYFQCTPCERPRHGTWLDCLSPAKPPGFCQDCHCQRFSMALFRVSRSMYEDAASVFWPNVTFDITFQPRPARTLQFIQSIPASGRGLIRELRFSFTKDTLAYLYRNKRPFLQWNGVLDHIRWYFDVPRLSIVVSTSPGAFEFVHYAHCGSLSKRSFFIYRFYQDIIEYFKPLRHLAWVDFENGYYVMVGYHLAWSVIGDRYLTRLPRKRESIQTMAGRRALVWYYWCQRHDPFPKRFKLPLRAPTTA